MEEVSYAACHVTGKKEKTMQRKQSALQRPRELTDPQGVRGGEVWYETRRGQGGANLRGRKKIPEPGFVAAQGTTNFQLIKKTKKTLTLGTTSTKSSDPREKGAKEGETNYPEGFKPGKRDSIFVPPSTEKGGGRKRRLVRQCWGHTGQVLSTAWRWKKRAEGSLNPG